MLLFVSAHKDIESMTYVYQEVNSGDHGVQGRAAAGNLAPETQMAAGHLSF